jgi:hypothetical protein
VPSLVVALLLFAGAVFVVAEFAFVPVCEVLAPAPADVDVDGAGCAPVVVVDGCAEEGAGSGMSMSDWAARL